MKDIREKSVLAVSSSTLLAVLASVSVLFCAVWAILGYRRRAMERRVPRWAGDLSADAFEDFLEMVQRDLAARGQSFDLHGGTLTLLSPGKSYAFDLIEVARAYREADKEKRKGAVAEAMDAMCLATTPLTEFETMPTETMQMTEQLLVQLLPADGSTADAASREELPGVRTQLVLDFPQAARNVRSDEIEQLGSPDDLFKIALENLRRQPAPTINTVELEPGLNAHLITGESAYIAAMVFLLAEKMDCVGEHGALVAIPTQGLLVCHPIKDRESLRTLVPMAWVAHCRYEEGPGAITPKLYWRTPEDPARFIEVPYNLRGPALRVTPPAELIERLPALES